VPTRTWQVERLSETIEKDDDYLDLGLEVKALQSARRVRVPWGMGECNL